MAVSRTITKKSPSQQPVDFFQCKQSGGTHGSTQKVGDRLKSGAMREKINGRANLGK
jgi:hypothetical protein